MFFSGFTVEFERVKNLPCGETQMFTVKFDTQGSSQKMGDISVVMPIQVLMDLRTLTCLRIWPWFPIQRNRINMCKCNLVLEWTFFASQVLHGPTVQVLLCAVVTEPSLTVSADNLQFDTIQCGMCQVRHHENLQRLSTNLLQWSVFFFFLASFTIQSLVEVDNVFHLKVDCGDLTSLYPSVKPVCYEIYRDIYIYIYICHQGWNSGDNIWSSSCRPLCRDVLLDIVRG